jgi:hypothetical protein
MILKDFSAMYNFLFEIFKIYFVIYPTWYVVDAEQAHAKTPTMSEPKCAAESQTQTLF